jgi:hypothetical protein
MASGAGADGTRGGRAADTADAVSVFALPADTDWYPMIDLLERMALRFDREESPQQEAETEEADELLGCYGICRSMKRREQTAPLRTTARICGPPCRLSGRRLEEHTR